MSESQVMALRQPELLMQLSWNFIVRFFLLWQAFTALAVPLESLSL